MSVNSVHTTLKWAVHLLAGPEFGDSFPEVTHAALQHLGIHKDCKVKPAQFLTSIYANVSLHPDGAAPKEALTRKLLRWSIPSEVTYPFSPDEKGAPTAPETPADIVEDATKLQNVENTELWFSNALVFLEKYGSRLPFTDQETHVPFSDGIRTLLAVQQCLELGEEENPFLFILTDLSGIQDTIYTISARGALKTLRGSSFMLELLGEHYIEELCREGEGVTRASVVYAGGGGTNLLIPNTPHNQDLIAHYKDIINDWLFREFNAKLFMGIAWRAYASVKPADYSQVNSDLTEGLNAAKNLKFKHQLWNQPQYFDGVEPVRTSNDQECQITHRDDVTDDLMVNLATGNSLETEPVGTDDVFPVYRLYHKLFRLGDKLTRFRQTLPL